MNCRPSIRDVARRARVSHTTVSQALRNDPRVLPLTRKRVRRDVGLVHLDWSQDQAPLAGLDADPEAVGEAAVDLLVGQLHANEYGIPRHEKIIAVKGQWVAGRSVRSR